MSSFPRTDIGKIESIIRRAGSKLLEISNQRIEIISSIDRDIKAKADHEIEIFLKEELSTHFPFKILGEEFSDSDSFEEVTGFVVDPIDGTMNFSRALPLYCISVAFVRSGKPELGFVYNPKLDEFIIGIASDGVYFNNQKMTHDLNIKSEQAIVYTGIPTKMDISNAEDFQNYLSKIKKFKKVRMIGSAAQSLAWLGINRADAYFEDSIMLWDVAAGLAIVEAAGGHYEMEEVVGKKWAYNIRAGLNKNILNDLI